jgi:hypothetical protein
MHLQRILLHILLNSFSAGPVSMSSKSYRIRNTEIILPFKTLYGLKSSKSIILSLFPLSPTWSIGHP